MVLTAGGLSEGLEVWDIKDSEASGQRSVKTAMCKAQSSVLSAQCNVFRKRSVKTAFTQSYKLSIAQGKHH
jgi:hypothetical protein